MTPSRNFWKATASIHHVVYAHPSANERFTSLGLKGGWMPYFASRSAPLGEPGPHAVTATFQVVAPRAVEKVIPAAWGLAERQAILDTRLAIGALGVSEKFGTPTTELVDALEDINARIDFAGRPMAAALADLPTPTDLVGRLWHAASILREYRGDSHLAGLIAAGINGVDALVLEAATGRVPADFPTSRGWNDAELAASADRLRERGWLDADGAATEAGVAAREELENTTDRSCAAGFDADAASRAEAITESLVAFTRSKK